MPTLWTHLAHLVWRQWRADGALSAALMCAGALRTMRHSAQTRALLELGIVRRFIVEAGDPDVLFHQSHRHYLCTTFGPHERVASALSHYRHEGERCDSRYQELVYGRGGLLLWRHRSGVTDYRLVLRASRHLRHEGAVSVVLEAGDTPLCEMSFGWVDAALLGLDGPIVAWITRNQSVHFGAPALARFRDDFPHNSPSYFCFAAVHGLVMAHGHGRIAGIRGAFQVAYEACHASGFRHSYDDFWRSFGGVPAGPVSCLVPVPLALPPLDAVKSKHRQRALARRSVWADIRESARMAMVPRLTGAAPPAVDGGGCPRPRLATDQPADLAGSSRG